VKTINVDVPEDIARRYLNMSPSEQLSVSKVLIRILEKRKGLREIMDDMSEQAKKMG
jgi:predicted CopG family antitoxin